MPTVEAIAAEAKNVMKAGAVIITAAEFKGNSATRLQVYFWDEHQAVMDVIGKSDLLENWPDDGVYALDTTASKAEDSMRLVHRCEGEEEIYIRTTDEDAEADELGTLPTVLFLESVEAICELKDKIKL